MRERSKQQAESHAHLHAFLNQLAQSESLKVRELGLYDVALSNIKMEQEEGEVENMDYPGTVCFFHQKGHHLHTLNIDYHTLYGGFSQMLMTIADTCNDLRHLTVTHWPVVSFRHLPKLTVDRQRGQGSSRRRNYLKRLKTFVFHGRLANPQDVLPTLLADAFDIEVIDYRIGFLGHDVEDTRLDTSNLSELMRLNPLKRLRKLTIGQCQLNPATVRSLLERCPTLEGLRYIAPPPVRHPHHPPIWVGQVNNPQHVINNNPQLTDNTQILEIINQRFPCSKRANYWDDQEEDPDFNMF